MKQMAQDLVTGTQVSKWKAQTGNRGLDGANYDDGISRNLDRSRNNAGANANFEDRAFTMSPRR